MFYIINDYGALVITFPYYYYLLYMILFCFIFPLIMLQLLPLKAIIYNNIIGYFLYSPSIRSYKCVTFEENNLFMITSELSRYIYLSLFTDSWWYRSNYIDIPRLNYTLKTLKLLTQVKDGNNSVHVGMYISPYGAENNQNNMIIIVRGTDLLVEEQWHTNFCFPLVNMCCTDDSKCHFGYLYMLTKKLRTHVQLEDGSSSITNIILTDYIIDNINSMKPNKIIISGHSQGAGMSKILGYIIMMTIQCQIEIHSYGGPRVFNKTATDVLKTRKDKIKIYNIIYSFDIIPRMLPTLNIPDEMTKSLLSFCTTEINIHIPMFNCVNLIKKKLINRIYDLDIREDVAWYGILSHLLFGVINHDPYNYVHAMQMYNSIINNIKIE